MRKIVCRGHDSRVCPLAGRPWMALVERRYCTEVAIVGYQTKDGSMKATGRHITPPNGSKLFVGSCGTGTPLDDRDATERLGNIWGLVWN